MKKHFLVVIQGPTASGKTAAANQLAKAFQTEIISADSRLFYKGMNIGTAKPTAEQLAIVPHHFIDIINLDESFTAGDYEKAGMEKLNELFQQHQIVVVAGGSGFYIKALCEGLDDFPEVAPDIRAQLQAEFTSNGIAALQQELANVDPSTYAQIDKQNPHRIMRALEVYRTSGQPFSSFQTQQKKTRDFTTIRIAINVERQLNYRHINQRVDEMMNQGLLQEVQSLLPYREQMAFQTVGYQEFLPYIDGEIDLITAINKVKQSSRRYAKRQMTWLRKETGLNWFQAEDIAGMTALIEKEIAIH